MSAYHAGNGMGERKPKRQFVCNDCGEDVRNLNELFYDVRDDVWASAKMPFIGTGLLCIGCLELRLGRQLVAADFTAVPANTPMFNHSDRLSKRMGF